MLGAAVVYKTRSGIIKRYVTIKIWRHYAEKQSGDKMSKLKNWRIAGSVLTLAAAVFAIAATRREKPDIGERICHTSIFSWEAEYMLEEYEPQLSGLMKRLGCEAVYQQIENDADEETVLSYLKRRAVLGQDVYYLAGSPGWGSEAGAVSMLEEVKKVKEWNRKAPKKGGFYGIVWDVEPYLLKEWKEEPELCIKQFVKNCEAAYKKAGENQLAVIVCIPNFYDSSGFEEELEQLVMNGCDGIAVMNYLKRDETGQIATEVELARRHQKAVINITEMQRPGYHELTDDNTYYNDGIDAAQESWAIIRETFNYPELGFSWHYVRPLLELMEAEDSG